MNRLIGALPSTLSRYTSKIPRFCNFWLKHVDIFVYWAFSSFLVFLQNSEQDVIDLPTLTAYVSYARKHIQPQLSDEAAEELTRGYVEMRRRGNFPGSSKKVIILNCYHDQSMMI